MVFFFTAFWRYIYGFFSFTDSRVRFCERKLFFTKDS